MGYLFFWGGLGALVFIYFGYPFLLLGLGKFTGRTVQKQPVFPRVTVLISAYNEQEHIEETVRNKLELDYPAELLNVMVISDGSTDRTEEIVHSIKSDRVTLLVQDERQGKTAALNRGVLMASGDIIVFSDANSLYDKKAIRYLAECFADPEVGYATGKMVYVDETGSLIGSGCSAYMRYENKLRELETQCGSVIGVDGGIDAVRRMLYRPMRADLLPDFVLPLSVIQQGFRVVYEDRALLKESTLTASEDKWKMRVRVGLRAFHALWYMRELFNPFEYPLISFQLLVHKLLRYWAGFFQIVVYGSNLVLWGVSPLYRFLFVAQTLFYLGAAAGGMKAPQIQKFPLVRHAFYFCLLNVASLSAFFRFVRGEKQVIWAPRKGS